MSGDPVDLEKYNVFRAAPEKAHHSREREPGTDGSGTRWTGLPPGTIHGAEGPGRRGGCSVRVPNRGRQSGGETVILGLAQHPNEGEWPEVAPHCCTFPPPDGVLAEQVKGSRPKGSRESLHRRGRAGLDGDQCPATRLLGPDRYAGRPRT